MWIYFFDFAGVTQFVVGALMIDTGSFVNVAFPVLPDPGVELEHISLYGIDGLKTFRKGEPYMVGYYLTRCSITHLRQEDSVFGIALEIPFFSHPGKYGDKSFTNPLLGL